MRHRHHHNRWHAAHLDYHLRRIRRRGGDELVALEEYQRDVEQQLADITERIRRVREQRAGSSAG